MEEIPYRVRRSDRARRARIVVRAEGVEVVVPRRASLRRVEPFVAERRPWIERTLRRLRAAEEALEPARLEDGGEVPYLGSSLELRVRVEPGRARARVRWRAGVLELAVGRPGAEPVRSALETWYRRRARAEVAARLDVACARAGYSYLRLSIRG